MFTHYLTPVNGIRLHYVSAGSGKPIVFLHGHPDFWYLWKDQLTHFARTHHVIAPDLRGYNLSDKPPEVADYRIPIVVEDIRSLADHLGLSPFTLLDLRTCEHQLIRPARPLEWITHRAANHIEWSGTENDQSFEMVRIACCKLPRCDRAPVMADQRES